MVSFSSSILIIVSLLAGGVQGWWQLSPLRTTALSKAVLEQANRDVLFPLMDQVICDSPSVIAVTTQALVGAWQVVCTKPGPKGEPKWVKYSRFLGGPTDRKNRDFQIFSSDGSFINLSEYISSVFFATASGSYEIQPMGSIPQVVATVDNVRIHVGYGSTNRRSLSLGVRGKGYVTIRYLDSINGLRIFENEDGAQVLQQLVSVPVEYTAFLR